MFTNAATRLVSSPGSRINGRRAANTSGNAIAASKRFQLAHPPATAAARPSSRRGPPPPPVPSRTERILARTLARYGAQQFARSDHLAPLIGEGPSLLAWASLVARSVTAQNWLLAADSLSSAGRRRPTYPTARSAMPIMTSAPPTAARDRQV